MVRRELDVLDELVHPDYQREDRFTPEPSREVLRQNLLDTKSAWQDRDVSIVDMIAEGDRVVVVLRARGKLSGEYKGLRPTHRTHESQGIAIVTLCDHQIIHVSTHWDYLSLFEEVGFKMSSIAEQNKLTALRFVHEVVINRDADAAVELASEDFVRRDSFRPIKGRSALIASLSENAWNQGQLTVRTTVCEGDQVALHLTGSGQQNSAFHGISVSGEEASSSGTAFLTIKDGKVTEVSSFWDYTGLFEQIGGVVARTA